MMGGAGSYYDSDDDDSDERENQENIPYNQNNWYQNHQFEMNQQELIRQNNYLEWQRQEQNNQIIRQQREMHEDNLIERRLDRWAMQDIEYQRQQNQRREENQRLIQEEHRRIIEAARIILQLADTEAQNGQFLNAVNQYTDALNRMQNRPAQYLLSIEAANIYLKRGKMYLCNHQYYEAILDFRNAVPLDQNYYQNHPTAHFDQGYAYARMANSTDAIICFQNHQHIALNDMVCVAHICFEQAQWQEVINRTTNNNRINLDARDKTTANIFMIRGISFSCLGDHNSAIAEYTRAITIFTTINSNFDNPIKEDLYILRALSCWVLPNDNGTAQAQQDWQSAKIFNNALLPSTDASGFKSLHFSSDSIISTKNFKK